MKIKFNNTLATIEIESSKDKDQFDAIKKNLKVMAPGAEYTYEYRRWKFSKGKVGWDGQVSVITTDTFSTGLLPEIRKILWQDFKATPTLIDQRPKFKPIPFVSSVNLRDYQEATFNACINNAFNGMEWPRGIIQLATGGGKTLVAIALYEYYNEPTLFLVHRKDLVTQTAERFKEFINVTPTTMIEGAVIPGDKNITIATIQTLSNLMEKGQLLPFMQGIKQVFFDEAHLIAASIAKGNSFVKVGSALENAHMRWGLTATPFMRDKYSNWLLKGVTGEVLFSKSSKDLIASGHLAPPKITILDSPNIPSCPDSWPACYDSGIVLNTARNFLIVEQLKTIDKPCIIMCKQVAHAKILQNAAKMRGYTVPILQGSSSQEERADVVADLISKKLDTIICTTIFDEGIDIPELKAIILAGAGKSAIKQIQRIGRLLRKSKGKQGVTVIDFFDRSNKVLVKHSKERIKICKEQGFEVNIPY
jgi:superfamily II DNA or RNA helicase